MLSRGWECSLKCWNDFYSAGMQSTVLECCLQDWNAFDRVGIPLYRVGMLSRVLEYFLQCRNTFVQGWNAF
jgi:hypothetical protein